MDGQADDRRDVEAGHAFSPAQKNLFSLLALNKTTMASAKETRA
jgi:hypothetical protein